jgi:Ca2+-binding EF-hand superfamily protein
MKLSATELDDMINELDGDGSGEIEFEEFIGVLSKDLSLGYSADDITNAFKMFARNTPAG